MGQLLNKYKNLPITVKASLWFLFASFLQKAISVVSTPVFTRIMSTGEYGQFSVFNSWYDIVTVFVSLGLYNGFYARGIVTNEKDKDNFTSATVGLSTILSLAWTVFYIFTKKIWNNVFSLNTTKVLLMLVIIFSTSIFNFWSVRERFIFNYTKVVILTIVVAIMRPLLGILFVIVSENKVTARIFAIALVNSILYFACYISLIKNSRKLIIKKYWIDAITFAIPLIPHYLSVSILNSSDKIMIERMTDASAAGIYGLGYSVAQLMIIFNIALNQTIEPLLYRYVKKQDYKSLREMAYLCISIITIVNLLLIAIAPELVFIFAPNSYHDAIFVIPPIAMGTFFLFFYNFFSIFEFYFRKTVYVAIATTAGAGLNILLNYLFIKQFGFIAAGYTTMFCYFLFVLFHYFFMRRICKKECGEYKRIYNLKILLLISVSFCGLGFIFLFTYNYPIVRYTILVLIVAVVTLKRKSIILPIKKMLAERKETSEA